jgi:D-alanine-D-alanine ligase-like ATP-grasp enzyme
MNFGKVAVLYGGASAEREVSLMSGSGTTVMHVALLHCMADLAKTARYKVRLNCWVFLIRAPA